MPKWHVLGRQRRVILASILIAGITIVVSAFAPLTAAAPPPPSLRVRTEPVLHTEAPPPLSHAGRGEGGAALPPSSFSSSSSSSALSRLVLGEPLDEFEQIHHGIYRCRGARSHVVFALKTECRPAQKWHGQQGWPEVAVYHFSRLFFGPNRSTVPAAAGFIVSLTPFQAQNVVHADRCGLGLDDPLSLPTTIGEHHVPLIGVALEWRGTHSDDALNGVIERHAALREAWSVAALKAGSGGDAREAIAQISDVMVLDYITANEDRESKNWFTVPDTTAGETRRRLPLLGDRRFAAMDNGWAFAGRDYRGSICGVDQPNLVCPPLLRKLSGSATCRRSKAARESTATVRNCRFRRATVARLKHLLRHTTMPSFPPTNASHIGTTAWESDVIRPVLGQLRADSLFTWLASGRHGREVQIMRRSGEETRMFSMALARYVHSCPTLPDDDAGALTNTRPQQQHDDIKRFFASSDDKRVKDTLLEWLALGMTRRARALSAHIDSCVAEFGAAAVLLAG